MHSSEVQFIVNYHFRNKIKYKRNALTTYHIPLDIQNIIEKRRRNKSKYTIISEQFQNQLGKS